jgi:hypothetical protein
MNLCVILCVCSAFTPVLRNGMWCFGGIFLPWVSVRASRLNTLFVFLVLQTALKCLVCRDSKVQHGAAQQYHTCLHTTVAGCWPLGHPPGQGMWPGLQEKLHAREQFLVELEQQGGTVWLQLHSSNSPSGNGYCHALLATLHLPSPGITPRCTLFRQEPHPMVFLPWPLRAVLLRVVPNNLGVLWSYMSNRMA